MTYNENPFKPTNGSSKIQINELFAYLKSTGEFINYDGALYVHDNQKRYYRRVPMDKIDLTIREYVHPDLLPYLLPQTTATVARMLVNDPSLFRDLEAKRQEYSHYINCINGVYDIRAKTVLDYDKAFCFTYLNNFRLLKDPLLADAPTFTKYVTTSLEYDVDNTKTKLLLQCLGYCLSSLEGARKAFFLVGKTRSGKSQLLNFLEDVIGAEDCTSVPLHRLGDRFSAGLLKQARVNICKELHIGMMKNVDVFKGIVSNERLYGEKKFESGFSFVPHCKLISAGNSLPAFAESDGDNEALFNRMVIIPFEKSMDADKVDVHLRQKLYEERDAICSIAVNMLGDLQSSKYTFIECQAATAYLNECREQNSSVPTFVENCCIVNAEEKVHTIGLYSAYEGYCRSNCLNALPKDVFRQYIKGLPGVSPSKFRLNNQSRHGFLGLGLRPEI